MLSIVAAIGKNRELGKDNKLLWHIPEDLKRFKEITNGHPIIMGRKTFESIGRVLPNRTNIVVTREAKYHVDGAIVVNSLERGIEEAKKILNTAYSIQNTEDEIFIIGGGQIFEQALPMTDWLYLTVVDATFDADTFFPDYPMFTKIISEEKGDSNGYKYTFLTLEK